MKAVVKSAVKQISPLLDAEAENLQAVLERLTEAYLAFIVSDEILPITRAIVSEAHAKGLGAALYDQGPRRGIGLLAEFFSEEMRRGRLRDADPLTAALHFKGLINPTSLRPRFTAPNPRGKVVVPLPMRSQHSWRLTDRGTDRDAGSGNECTRRHVRFGSKADIPLSSNNVCFWGQSGH